MSARRIAIIATAVVGIAALVGAVAYFMPIFKVQNFSIRGQHNTSVEDIQSATHISIGANLMRIDAPSAAHSVAQLPWVDKATVTREFPNTVDVEVQERTAALYVKRDDGERKRQTVYHRRAAGRHRGDHRDQRGRPEALR